MGTYKVYVDDNFHYMDENERYYLGSFDDCETAISACKKIVEDFVNEAFIRIKTEDELFDYYTSFGEDPFIMNAEGRAKCRFSAWNYAIEFIKIIVNNE